MPKLCVNNDCHKIFHSSLKMKMAFLNGSIHLVSQYNNHIKIRVFYNGTSIPLKPYILQRIVLGHIYHIPYPKP